MVKTNLSSLVWFRRDLRVSDNRALFEACNVSEKVFCAFIFDTNILSKIKNNEDRRVSFIYDSLMELKENLKAKGGELYILFGDPKDLIPKLATTLKVEKVFTNEDYESYARKRDLSVSKSLSQSGIEFFKYKDHVIFRGNEVLKGDGTPYRVFTPYKNEWLRRLDVDALIDYKPKLTKLAKKNGLKFNLVKSLKDIGFKRVELAKPAGEKNAKKLFNSFLKRIEGYSDDRDKIYLNNNSHLSPYLRFGCISPREVVRKSYVLDSKGAKTWLSEIVWRDFYSMILDQFPHVEKSSFNIKYSKINWPGNPTHFTKWKKGQTGYPIIDAAMRCFSETGEMHNRLRMIVASFLVKDLLIDWKKGEKYFAENLLDFDLASNNGGWQWCASTGCDAQPYFRIFNPTSQSEKFDPDGEFIKKWVPELSAYPKKLIHFPSKAEKELQEELGCIIGRHYPMPIVDHSRQRDMALRLFKRL